MIQPRLLLPLFILAAFVAAPSASHAVPMTLEDNNAILMIDPSDPKGIFSWVTDGREDVNQEWFWYRVGGSGGEMPVSSLTLNQATLTDINGDGDDENLFLRFLGTGFELEIVLAVDGGAVGSKSSQITESITINNTSGSVLDFHFFAYTDFDLSAKTPIDDSVEFENANKVVQTDGQVVSQASLIDISSSVSFIELDFFSSTRDSLNDGNPTTLSTAPGATGPIGPGNLTWAAQWDNSIAAGSSFQVGIIKNVVPEPTTALTTLLGLAGISAIGRARKRH